MTLLQIEKLVDDTKDLTPEEQRIIAKSLGITVCALYVLKMKSKYNKKNPCISTSK